jgi:hypothetical protein
VLSKHHEQLLRLLSPSLEPGERPEFTGLARVSAVPPQELADGSGSGPTTSPSRSSASRSVARTKDEAFVVLTDRRMMVIGKGFASRPTPRVSWVIAREDIRPLRFTRGVRSSIELDVARELSPVRLTFPRAEREDAERLAAALDLPAA